MEKLISEQIVDSILSQDKEAFADAFNAAIAAKVSDALEVKKVEIASSLITPEMAVEEEVEQVDETYKSAIRHIKKYDYDKAVNALKHDPETQKAVKKHLNSAVRHQDKYYNVVDAMHKAGEKAGSITRLSDREYEKYNDRADGHEYNRQKSHNTALDLVHSKNNMSEEAEQIDEANNKYEVTKTKSRKMPMEFDSEAKMHHYDVHHNDKRVGTLTHDTYFGETNGKLHGKDLPNIRNYGDNPHNQLHNFLKSKTGQKWAANLHKYQKEEVEQVEEGAKEWKQAFKKVASKNLNKDVAAVRSSAYRLDKATKSDDEDDEEVKDKVRKGMSEEAEQIDELKKSTLKSYVKKANREMKKAYDYHQMGQGGRDGTDQNYLKNAYPKALAKYDRRDAGVEKAKQKLAKSDKK